MPHPRSIAFPGATQIALWLWIMCTLVVIMVAVGGITRITESGLSMVRWEPVKGVMAPQSEEAWQAAFDDYKERAGAQFEKFSADREMTLQDYKKIYFWEYAHRILGRVLGLAYLIPLIYFQIRMKLPRHWSAKLWIGFLLIVAQGVLGWFMVMSGFADKPYVSHFRLASHLCMALFLLGYMVWLILDLIPFWTHRHENYDSVKRLRNFGFFWLGLLTLQIVYGAFTAGLRAGYFYNTYPKMGRKFFPWDGISEHFGSVLGNAVNNPVLIQFIHRHLGLLVLVVGLGYWCVVMQKRHLMERQKLVMNLMMLSLSIQFILGIFTLISGMSMPVAVAHQVCACFVLGSGVAVVHELTAPKTVTSRRS